MLLLYVFTFPFIQMNDIIKLDMLTARQHLKSPRSLSGTSTHPTMVTQKSISWSWMDDSHLFRSMSIDHPVLGIRLFQTLTLKLQGQDHGCGQRERSYSQPSILLICFLFISHQSDQYPVSNQCTSFYFCINRTNHSWDMAKRVFDLEKKTFKIFKENLPKNCQQDFSRI